MDASRKTLVDAGTELDQRLDAFRKQVTDLVQHTKLRAVEYVALRTKEMAKESIDDQTRAMTQAARSLFNNEVSPTLTQLTASLRHIVERADRPWILWLTHAATAVASAAIACNLTVYFWYR